MLSVTRYVFSCKLLSSVELLTIKSPVISTKSLSLYCVIFNVELFFNSIFLIAPDNKLKSASLPRIIFSTLLIDISAEHFCNVNVVFSFP